jgi:membrane-bound lytic murein transglycosylase B
VKRFMKQHGGDVFMIATLLCAVMYAAAKDGVTDASEQQYRPRFKPSPQSTRQPTFLATTRTFIPTFSEPEAERPKQRSVRSNPTSVSSENVPSDTTELIKRIAAKYDVPAGALYGVWKVESGGLTSGWGTAERGWVLAHDMTQSGSRCFRERNERWCKKQWRSLVSICAQSHRDGTPVCDPYKVRTSWAFAMGPMQHLPDKILDFDGDRPYWTDRHVDFDGDRTVDPNDLPDALAMSAVFLRQLYARHNSWQKAVNGYYGSQHEGYMEGTTGGKIGVADHWQAWCKKYNCS